MVYTCTHSQVARAREELAIFVKADGHDAVRGVERLLNAVTMVDVDVNVNHAGVISARSSAPA
jgi:hypothetical protein